MSRSTGNDAKALMEAYAAVYAPQKLTEEQIWEEVENWVNSLIEEGYDLSEYTWEDMYEAYIEERRGAAAGLANRNVIAPAPTSRPQIAGGGMGGMRGSGRNRTATQTSSSPGALRITPTPAPAPQRPTAPAPQRPTAPAPQRPTAPAPQRPTATPSRSKVSPTTSTSTSTSSSAPATTTSAPTPPAKPEQALSKLPGGNYSGDATKLMSQRTKNILGTTKTPAARLGGARERMLNQNFDLYDAIKGHLLDEGYADTEEAAVAIMANMSEEWKQNIIENRGMAYSGGKPGASGDGSKPKGITGGKTYQMPGWSDKDDKKQVKDA